MSINRNPGNIQYRTWVDLFRADYCRSMKVDKIKLSARVVAMVLVCGGRFLEFDESRKRWMPISDRKAIEKTSQALREIPKAPQSTDKFKATHEAFQKYQAIFLKLWNAPKVLKRGQEILDARSTTSRLDIQPGEPFRYLPSTGIIMPRKRSLSSMDLSTTDSELPSKIPAFSSKFSTQKKEDRPFLLTTTIDNHRIRATTLELDDYFSSSEDEEISDKHTNKVTIQPTNIRLSKDQRTQPLYNSNIFLTDDEVEGSQYIASHDFMELEALGKRLRYGDHTQTTQAYEAEASRKH